MTWGRRWLTAAVAILGSATLLSAVAGCSGSDAQVPATSAPTTAASPGEPPVPETSNATMIDPVTTTTVPSTSTPTSALATLVPPVDLRASASTREILELPGVAEWVEGVRGVTRTDDMSCDRIEDEAPELSAAVATQVIAIEEPTLQEMLLNFDAAASSAVALCQQGSPTEAAAEWADAVALAAFIDERIALL